MYSEDELLTKKKEILDRISHIEVELNDEKDNEDMLAGHDNPEYLRAMDDLRVHVELLRNIEELLLRYKK